MSGRQKGLVVNVDGFGVFLLFIGLVCLQRNKKDDLSESSQKITYSGGLPSPSSLQFPVEERELLTISPPPSPVLLLDLKQNKFDVTI